MHHVLLRRSDLYHRKALDPTPPPQAFRAQIARGGPRQRPCIEQSASGQRDAEEGHRHCDAQLPCQAVVRSLQLLLLRTPGPESSRSAENLPLPARSIAGGGRAHSHGTEPNDRLAFEPPGGRTSTGLPSCWARTRALMRSTRTAFPKSASQPRRAHSAPAATRPEQAGQRSQQAQSGRRCSRL